MDDTDSDSIADDDNIMAMGKTGIGNGMLPKDVALMARAATTLDNTSDTDSC